MRTYRKLNINDLPMVMNMNRDLREGFIVEENARLFVSKLENWIFACVEDGRILGFAYGYELNRLDGKGNMLYIHEVGVVTEYHRQGIGRGLIENLKTVCKSLEIGRFHLFTGGDNAPANALYQALGGTPGWEDNNTYRGYWWNL